MSLASSQALANMHRSLARRENASSMMVASMAQLGRPLFESIAAALLTLGGTHAPITQTRRLLDVDNRFREIDSILENGGKVPGFGSAFYKGEPDPEVEVVMATLRPATRSLITRLGYHIYAMTVKQLYPNAAMATAAVAMDRGLSAIDAPRLIIEGRLPVWVSIHSSNFKAGPQ